jgi:hypothetical protein
VNDKIRFSQQEWKCLVESGLEGGGIDGDWFRYLACLPDLMQRCKRALHCSSIISDTSLLDLKSETNSLLEDCKINITALRDRLTAFEEDPTPFRMTAFLHAHRVRLLSLALTTGIILSCILSSLSGKPLRLCSQSSQWSHEILHLAEVAVRYQPLGSMAMILCLRVAWIGTASENIREKIKTLLADYEKACQGHPSSTDLTANLEWMERRFTLKEPWLEDSGPHGW